MMPKNSEIKNKRKRSDDGSVAVKPNPKRRNKVHRESAPRRSSVYRGVTRHRWTGRFEAHLWDKDCWNETQKKKGRQVYLGAYEEEAAAVRAYDLAALKYWGHHTTLNFPVSNYEEELKEMEGQSREEYISSLRRKSSGFSRGVSKYRGVARCEKYCLAYNTIRHHHNGKWEARIGRVFGNKYLYLGTYATQEEAATAYDMAAIEYRGLNAVTNFDLSRYINSLRPDNNNPPDPLHQRFSSSTDPSSSSSDDTPAAPPKGGGGASALELLLQSSKFKEMLERNAAAECPQAPSQPPGRIFPDDIQTYFDDSQSYMLEEGDDHHEFLFTQIDSLASTFQYEFLTLN